MNKDVIKGILLVLNKLYWKVPAMSAGFIVAEASDIPGLGGYFKFVDGIVVFKESRIKRNK